MSALYGSNDLNAWNEACRNYNLAISVKNKPELAALDKWMICELPGIVHNRSVPKLLKPELSRLMKWKLMKGKFRPNLQKYVDELPEEEIIDCTTKAFEFIDNNKLQQAINTLCKLKGIGPATASGILSVYDPNVPFMSDEALENVVGSRNYTLQECVTLTANLRTQAEKLNNLEREKEHINIPHHERDIGRTIDTGRRNGKNSTPTTELSSSSTTSTTAKKVQSEDDDDNEDATVPPSISICDMATTVTLVRPKWTANRCQLAVWANTVLSKAKTPLPVPSSSSSSSSTTATNPDTNPCYCAGILPSKPKSSPTAAASSSSSSATSDNNHHSSASPRKRDRSTTDTDSSQPHEFSTLSSSSSSSKNTSAGKKSK